MGRIAHECFSLFNFDNLEGDLSAGRFNFNLLTRFFAQQGFAHRAFVANAAIERIRSAIQRSCMLLSCPYSLPESQQSDQSQRH